jgi:dipeptidase E
VRIVAIGGGDLRQLETLIIDRHIVGLTGKRRPRALFIPTAAGDSAGYVETFAEVYGRRLGCRVETLRLIADPPSARRMREMIEAADLIYVGGGDTLRMMRRWRTTGADRLLLAAARRGTVMSGLSAGAICWFQYGDSDSRKFTGSLAWKHIRVRGLGLVPLLFCPHYDVGRRSRPLRGILAARGGTAIACDDGTAVETDGRMLHPRVFKRGAKVRAFWKDGERIRVRILDDPVPISNAGAPL